jgi:hypothetical protein
MWLVDGLDEWWPNWGDGKNSERARFAGRSSYEYMASSGYACFGARSVGGSSGMAVAGEGRPYEGCRE